MKRLRSEISDDTDLPSAKRTKKEDDGFIAKVLDSLTNFLKSGLSYFFPSEKTSSMDNQNSNLATSEDSVTFEQSMTDLEYNEQDLIAQELLSAVYDDDLPLIEKILSMNPDLLNYQDTDGFTPLHHAVLNNHFNCVEFLLKQGALADIPDNHNYAPINYANEYPDIKALLLAHGAVEWDPLYTELHIAAHEGNLQSIHNIVRDHPELLNAKDKYGRTPLFDAVEQDKLDAVKLLLEFQADPSIVDYFQRNIIHNTKESSGNHNSSSKYLKETIRFSQNELSQFQHDCTLYLESQFILAKQQKKKLLIVLGEHHGDYKTHQLEKSIVKAAHALGISTFYIEAYEDTPQCPVQDYAKDKLNMEIFGVDKHPSRAPDFQGDAAGLKDRDEIIRDEIYHQEKHGISNFGAEHLFGILQRQETSVDPNKYHLVSFNITPFAKVDLSNPEIIFAYSDPNIIQIEDCYFPVQESAKVQKPILNKFDMQIQEGQENEKEPASTTFDNQGSKTTKTCFI